MRIQNYIAYCVMVTVSEERTEVLLKSSTYYLKKGKVSGGSAVGQTTVGQTTLT